MKPAKVIFVCYSLAGGGAERRIATLSGKLVERGVQVKILLLDSPTVVFDLHPEVEIVYLGEKSEDDAANARHPVVFHPVTVPAVSVWDKIGLKWTKLFRKAEYPVLNQQLDLEQRYIYRLYDYLKAYPDWLIVPCMTLAILSTMKALMKLHNKVAFVECTDPASEFPAHHPISILKQRWYPRAIAGIFQTEEERDFYTYLSCKKFVIPNPIFGNYPERYEGIRNKEIVNFCRFSRVKNLPLLIDAFSLLSAEYPDYSLHLYGNGEEKETVVAYVMHQGLSDKVIFHDFDVNLHDKIKDSAMFVSSSDREGISNSMLEAMAIGLPTICTDCPAGGARMMITPYENGLLVPVRDKQALYQAMKELIEQPELADKLSRNSVKIKERLNVERIVDAWLQVIKDINEQ